MKYSKCNHKGCDICGTRGCDPFPRGIKAVGQYEVCDDCIKRAVKFTYEVACKFGGTVIDPHKPCGRVAASVSAG